MDIATRKGIGFGLTSGVITTLGIILGLNSATNSKLVVIGGILTIAIADAFSDSLGVHMSEESGSKSTKEKKIWESTISTFFSKFFFALTFLIPVLLLKMNIAIIISILWGLFLITIFSYYIAKLNNHNVFKTVFEHLLIAIIVIFLTSNIDKVISLIFEN